MKCNVLVILILMTTLNVSGQQVFRRHFVIAYDVSSPFIRAKKSCPAYEKALIGLFSNRQVDRFNEAYQDNLKVETKNGVPFFDKDRDEISFFHFNIASSEFAYLNNVKAIRSGENKIVSDFNRFFIKNKQWCWSSNKKGEISDYFRTALSITPKPADFGGGVSMSNFVYPLVLDKMDTTKYAEEYILIILSDFLTGSMLGNTKDLDRVRDIYSIGYEKILSETSPVNLIKKRIDYLASQYYKIDFLQYSFTANVPPSNRIGIIAYKIKPKTGVLTPEDVALFVDSDLNLYQRGYQSPKFKTTEAKIKFTHNKNLVATELGMTISLPDKSVVLFEDVIASKNSENEWFSNYTNNANLMKRDSLNYTYTIPVLKISLDSIINGEKLGELKFEYVFKTKYKIENAQSLNFIYKTERALAVENIDYTTKATIVIMYYLLPIVAFLVLLIILINYGKPRKLKFTLAGYLDSFEKVDFLNEGKTNTPYKPWDYERYGGVDFLPVTGIMEFNSAKYLFNWDSLVRLQLIVNAIPKGFELFLKHKPDGNEFSPDLPISIKKGKNDRLSFWIGIRQTDINKQITDPELVKFHIEAVASDSFLFIKSDIRQTAIEYKFLIGPDLQNVWVAFDPGTTGSCVAVGSASNNIILSKNRWEQEIIPSVIVFDKTGNYKDKITTPPETVSSYGELAERRIKNTDRFVGYRSFKKLLGFKDEQKIIFDNGNQLSMKGRDLAALLVKGLYNDLETYVNSRPNADEYKRGEQGGETFNPLRAVVTIPNNFTASKIQDMIYCIDNLKQFKEIRYVYEAEAVLFYYLSNYSKYNPIKPAFDTPENILIFDMGGATINVTIVAANKTSTKYNIDFLGKIGYGIGGDTIDYCIIKFLMANLPELREINIFDKKTKEKLIPLILQIKQEMFANYSNKSVKKLLIEPNQLSTFINDILDKKDDEKIVIDDTCPIFQYLKSEEGAIALQDFFAEIIYQNIKDAINELMELSGNVPVDKIIFSGRSTGFPMIRETVENTLKARNINAEQIILGKIDKSKTVVAEGACWYGINKNSVHLNNRKTNSSFGFMRTLSADRNDIKFSTLIQIASVFNDKTDGLNFIIGIENIADKFNFDGNQVNFYQIMGKDAKKILSEQQKHKFSKVADIQIPQSTVQVGMQVSENDVVDCKVKLDSNRVLQEHGFVIDQEISDANEEHYTWMVE